MFSNSKRKSESEDLKNKRLRTTIIFICLQIILLTYVFPSCSANSNTETQFSAEKRIVTSDVYTKVVESAKNLIGAIDRGEDLTQPFDDLMTKFGDIEAEDKEVHKRFQDIEEKTRSSGSAESLSRHQKILGQYESKMSELKAYYIEVKRAVESNARPETIRVRARNLIEFIEKSKQGGKVELRHAENRLPWRVVEPGEVLLLGDSSSIPQPAAPAGPTSPPTGNELSATVDVQITPEIQDLASSLGNRPVNIFRHVYNEYDYTPYYGSMKGSLDTFWEKEGNDYDLASLLIALLRASNIPARYVTAKIVIPIENVMRWIDFNDPMSALQYLASAKIPIAYYTGGGKISHVQIEHVYVEAYVPYGNYRGTGEDDTGKAWIPMDPSFKRYKITQEGIDIASQMGFDWKTFSDEYLGGLRNITPIEYYKSKIDQYISQNYSGQTIDSLKRIIQLSKMQFDFLPDSLPYMVSEVLERFSEIPQGQRHTLRFTIPGALDYSTSLPEVSGRRITLAFDGATAEDQAVIKEYGNIAKTPPYLIEVKPILRIGGNKVAEGIAMNCGISATFNILYTQPGETETFNHNITTGSFNAVGITTGKVRPDFLTIAKVEATAETYMSKMLHSLAMKYQNEGNKTRQILNDTMKIKSRAFFNEALVSTKHNTQNGFWGIPTRFDISGYTIDAQEIATGIQPLDRVHGKKVVDFMMVGGFEASYQENRVFEDSMFFLAGLSAVKGLQLLKAMGVTIEELEPFQVYYNPYFYDVVNDDINNALNMGWRVIVPRSTQGLAVTPYIKYDPNTGSAGYMIATAAGGTTKYVEVSPGLLDYTQSYFISWTDPDLTLEKVRFDIIDPEDGKTFALGDTFFAHAKIILTWSRDGEISTEERAYDDYGVPWGVTIRTGTSILTQPMNPWLKPGHYTLRYDGEPIFNFNVWGPEIDIEASDKYLGISTENGVDTIKEPLKVRYSTNQMPGVNVSYARMKVYREALLVNDIINIPIGENQVVEWDGTYQIGGIAPPGEYTIVIEATGNDKDVRSNELKVTVFKAEVVSADVTQDSIQIRLKPDGISGTLRLELDGEHTYLIREQGRSGRDTVYSETFNITSPNFVAGVYGVVKATWKIGEKLSSYTKDYPIRMLGVYRHSQYNSPDESRCSGEPNDVYILSSHNSCFNSYQEGTLKSDFISQVNINGSGISEDYGGIKSLAATRCSNETENRPEDATGGANGNSFVQAPITGSCGTTLSNSSLARCTNDTRLSCGDRIYIHTQSVKIIQDRCPACCGAPGMQQLDNYTSTDTRCRPGEINDLGRFITIKICERLQGC